MYRLNIAKIISGPLEQYLKDIELVGSVKEDKQFYIFGCGVEDENLFYEGILKMDKAEGKSGLGFNAIEEVEEFWLNGCDGMFLTAKDGNYKIIR